MCWNYFSSLDSLDFAYDLFDVQYLFLIGIYHFLFSSFRNLSQAEKPYLFLSL